MRKANIGDILICIREPGYGYFARVGSLWKVTDIRASDIVRVTSLSGSIEYFNIFNDELNQNKGDDPIFRFFDESS